MKTGYDEVYTPMFITALFTLAKKDMGTTQIPINQKVDKKDVVHIHSGILLSHEKGGNPACNYMDGPWGD